MALLEGLTRIAVTYLDGEYSVKDGYRDEEGTVTQIDDVLEGCWQAAMAVRAWLKRELEINAYVVAAAVFANMEPDDSILAAAASRGTRVLFGLDDHVERLAALPGEQDLQHPLRARYIPERCGGAEPPAGGGCRGTGTGDGDPGGGRGPRGDPR